MKRKVYTLLMVMASLFFLSIAPAIGYAQTRSVTVSGQVTDEKRQPLVGVSVKLKNSDFGVATNSEGRFTISVPGNNRVLVLSYLGYEDQEVTATSAGEYNTSMVPSVSTLNEVVVIGYSTQRRKDVSGSVVSISQDQLKNQSVTGFDQALKDRQQAYRLCKIRGHPEVV